MVLGMSVRNSIPLPGSRQRELILKHMKPPIGFPKALSGEREVQKASGIWMRNLLFDMEQTF